MTLSDWCLQFLIIKASSNYVKLNAFKNDFYKKFKKSIQFNLLIDVFKKMFITGI